MTPEADEEDAEKYGKLLKQSNHCTNHAWFSTATAKRLSILICTQAFYVIQDSKAYVMFCRCRRIFRKLGSDIAVGASDRILSLQQIIHTLQ